MNGKLLTTTTQVRIGNNGEPAFHITDKNEILVKQALKEFTDKMFDASFVNYYVKIDKTDCILESLRMGGCMIQATLKYYTNDDSDEKSLEQILLEESLKGGSLFLGCEYEFDTTKKISPQYLSFPKNYMEQLCTSDQLSFVKFHMLYYYYRQTETHTGFRRTIYRIPEI